MTSRLNTALSRRLWFAVAAGLALRTLFAAVVWTPYFRPQYEGTHMRATRTAYAVAAGLGYSHYERGSEAHKGIVALLAKGDGWEPVSPEDGERASREGLRPEFLYPPGWPVVGAGLHRITGAPVWLCMQAFGVVCGTLAVVFTYWVVVETVESERLALGTAWAVALFPPLAYGSVTLYAMTAVPCLALAVTWLIVRGVRRAGWSRWAHYLAAGVCSGIAGYFRADYLLIGPAVALAIWPAGYGLRHALAAAAVVGGFAFAALTPWAMRNHSLGGGWTFTSCGTGGVLVNGLSGYPENPWGFRSKDEGRHADASEQGIGDPWGPAGDAYFKRRFREALVEHPVAAGRIFAQRVAEGFVAPHDWGLAPMGEDVRGSDLRMSGTTLSRLGTIVTSLWSRALSAVVVVLGNVGCAIMYFSQRRRHPLVILLIAAPVYALAVHVFSHMMPMYLLPGLYAQLLGLVFLVLRGWRESSGRTTKNVAARIAAA